MLIALNLAPVDRHIIRSAVRFFIHSDDIEAAWDYVRAASSAVSDPWIKAQEINVGQLIDRKVKRLKHVIPKEASPQEIFQLSELLESVGMREFVNGNDIQAKRHFRAAWQNPSVNVVAHAEWVLRNRLVGAGMAAGIDFSKSLEAHTLQKYFDLDIEGALLAATEWSLEEPYRKHPFSLGIYLAAYTKQFDVADRLAREGLRANPREFELLNNYSFSLLRANKVNEARNVMDRIEPPREGASKVIYLATSGLLQFKLGHSNQGRRLYKEAIQLSIDQKDSRLAAKALLNLAIAELEAGTTISERQKAEALSSTENLDSPDILITRNELKNTIPHSPLKPQ